MTTGWSDPNILAEMAALGAEAPPSDIDKQYAESFTICDSLEKSPNLRIQTIARIGRVLSATMLDVTKAVESGDNNKAAEITQGILISMSSCLAALLSTEKGTQEWVMKTFEESLNTAIKMRIIMADGKS